MDCADARAETAWPWEAVLLVSFGGPEGPDEVMPFLRAVTRGRGVPDGRLAEVAGHYHALGGVSPINAANRALRAAVEADLAARGRPLPVYWGNRNWRPLLADAVRRMRDDGVRRAAAFATSTFSSYSGCRQYREDLAAAVAEVAADGRGTVAVDKLRPCLGHPGFADPLVDAAAEALGRLGPVDGPVRLVFTTHSLPLASAASSGPPGAYDPADGGAYVAQQRAVAAAVAARVGRRAGRALGWDLVFQSRSGPPSVPWLGPDVRDHLGALAAGGAGGVVLVPVGFVSDHVEVVWDLDTEALDRARELGLPAVRAATVGTDPRFAAVAADLLDEAAGRARAAGPGTDAAGAPAGPDAPPGLCSDGCCANPRGARPAVPAA